MFRFTRCFRALLVLLCAAAVIIPATDAVAGRIVVVGDQNAADPADDIGNKTFYTNLLGTTDNVWVSRFSFAFINDLRAYYDSLSGVTATASNATVTSASLAGYGLFVVAPFYNTALDYTAAEVSALADFLDGGGDILMVGEAYDTAVVDSYNDFLGGVGSAIRFTEPRTSGALGTIASDPLTAGVTSFHFVVQNPLTGGTALISTDLGDTVIATEGTGSATANVSEPAPLAVLGLGLAGFAAGRRRSARRVPAQAGGADGAV